jgi:hypothetical protein
MVRPQTRGAWSPDGDGQALTHSGDLHLPWKVWVYEAVQAAAGVLLIVVGWGIGAFGLALFVGAGIALQRDEQG